MAIAIRPAMDVAGDNSRFPTWLFRPQDDVWSLDQRGAVFVEKLIAFLPLLLTFFATWELAEFTAAKLIVARASSAAGRAAVVVLPDDPVYYDGEAVNDYSGLRREDIELAAAMILSANPRITDQFEVEVDNIPTSGSGPLEVTVTAEYDCGSVGLMCSGGTTTLTATTQHAYHGAKYAYASPGALDSAGSALTAAADADFRAGMRGGEEEDDDTGSAGYRAGGRISCAIGAGAEHFIRGDLVRSDEMGTEIRYGSGDSVEALRHRCKTRYWGGSNVAVVYYNCGSNSCIAIGQSSHNGPHAEREAMREFEKAQSNNSRCRVERVYTERAPCKDTQRCGNWLANQGFDESTVSFSSYYNAPSGNLIDTAKVQRFADACDRVKGTVHAWKRDQERCGKRVPDKNTCDLYKKYASKSRGSSSDVEKCAAYLAWQRDKTLGSDAHYWRKAQERYYDDMLSRGSSLCDSLPPKTRISDRATCQTGRPPPPPRTSADVQQDIDRTKRKINKLIDYLENGVPPGVIPKRREAYERDLEEAYAQLQALRRERDALLAQGH